jgi:hypothetical protein
MSRSDEDTPRWRRLLLNRFVVVPAAIALAILFWNLYVARHDNGIVEGRVVDRQGAPVADAVVALWVLNFTTYVEKTRTRTGSDGRFRFTGNDSHNLQLAAEKPGLGASPRVPVRLYFKGQDVALREPLRLAGN